MRVLWVVGVVCALLVACSERYQPISDGTTAENRDIGALHNAAIKELERMTESASRVTSDDVVEAILTVAANDGWTIADDAARELMHAVLHFAVELRYATGIDLHAPRTLTSEQVQVLFDYLVREHGVGQDIVLDGMRVVSGGGEAARSIYENSVRYWTSRVDSGAKTEFDDIQRACRNNPNCRYDRELGMGVVDIVGGLYGALFGPVGMLVGSVAMSTFFMKDTACCGCRC